MTSSSRNLIQVLRRRVLPWLVFAVTAGTAVCLWSEVGQRSPIIGFVQSVEHPVSPTHPGRIQRIAVQVGQPVSAGQVVAVLDGVELEAEFRIQEAEQERVRAEGTREQLRALSTTSRFAEAQEGASAALAKANAEHRFKAAELETLSRKRAELAELLSRGMVVKRDLINVELRQAALENEVRSTASTARLLQQQRRSAQARNQALPDKAVELSLAPLKAKLAVIERRLEKLVLQRESLTLRAPCDGRVAVIHQHEGGVAQVGKPVVSVIADAADRVVACVYENMAAAPRVGMAVALSSRLGESKRLTGHVLALGPMVAELPRRCRPQPSQHAWGREMVVLLDKPGNVLAGEGFSIHLEEHGSVAGEAMAAPVAGRERTPERMTVPAALAAVSRFEPSGLVWVPRLGRYLIVSDDTGHAQRDDHAPWLFTMDARGRVDERPLRVEGVDQLNDLESIAPGPGGTLYVLSSQTFSKKGKRKLSRQAFLRLAPAAFGYRATGAVNLAELLDGAPKGVLASLGIADTSRLNIEGMTAASEGGLLIGLKAPLRADGGAIIWRTATPERLFSSGRLEDAGLSAWGTLKLQVEADGQTVPGGIAELLQLPDGALLVTATASGLKPRSQSGSLWLVPQARAAARSSLSARRVQTFAGQKPEGLALSPKPGHVVVAFDADQGHPAWLELPWPR